MAKSLKWTVSTFEEPGYWPSTTTIKHWQKIDYKKLLAALATVPVRSSPPESLPQFTVHKFGPHEIVAREFHPSGKPMRHGYFPPERIFTRLASLAEKHHAIVEMPVAFIMRSYKKWLVVTLWKKNSSTLQEALLDKNKPIEEKQKLALKALSQLAHLHAAGYLHNHPYSRNFVVLKNGAVHFVDPTVIVPIWHKMARKREAVKSVGSLLREIKIEVEKAGSPLTITQLKQMKQQLKEHYVNSYQKSRYRIQLAKRKVRNERRMKRI